MWWTAIAVVSVSDSVEFKGKDGFWLNGKPYESPLIGANRHQDFAVVGNAVANSIHWRDAKKLRDAGMKVIRNAHCPQDPAFMDACDELGLFVIVNTPGWRSGMMLPNLHNVYTVISATLCGATVTMLVCGCGNLSSMKPGIRKTLPRTPVNWLIRNILTLIVIPVATAERVVKNISRYFSLIRLLMGKSGVIRMLTLR